VLYIYAGDPYDGVLIPVAGVVKRTDHLQPHFVDVLRRDFL
jgi:hypothetical protein